MKKIPPAVKHGGYSSTTILPGESRSDFNRLHEELIAELHPDGALEHDVVTTIAQLVWRKGNLATFRKAELATRRLEAIKSQYLPDTSLDAVIEAFGPKIDWKAARQAADEHARKELGRAYQLIEVGETATLDRLTRELEVEDRLQTMIDRQLKRLLFLRGLKSLPAASSSTPLNCLPAPLKAA
jgi:hypothetical protein